MKAEYHPNLSSVALRRGPSISGQNPGTKRARNRNRNPPSRNDDIGASDNSELSIRTFGRIIIPSN